MARARVNNQEGAERIIAGWHVIRRRDAHQGVIHRALQLAAIHHSFEIKNQHGRAARLFVGDEVIAGFAHSVPEQETALRRIQHVGSRIHRQILGRTHQTLSGLGQAFQRRLRVHRLWQGLGVAAYHISHDARLFKHTLGGRIAFFQQFPAGRDGALRCHGTGSCFGYLPAPVIRSVQVFFAVQQILLEHFQAKWNHLAARKMRPNKGLARIQ